jgi:hypothetical protein
MRLLSALLLVTTGFSSSFLAFAGGVSEPGQPARQGSQTSLFNAKPQGATSSAVAGDSPFVYRQVGYLATVGPAPLRFGPPSPGCNERTPPRVASTSRKPIISQQPAAPIEVTPSTFVPTSQSTEESRGSVTEEAINFYRPQELDPEVQKRRMRFMFDPVQGFQAAPPPASTVPPAAAPQSRATFRQN